MTDTTNNSTPATPPSPSRAPSFAEKRAVQESAGSVSPAPSSTPRSQSESHWQDGKSLESKHARAHAAADAERLEGARAQHGDQPQQRAPGAPPASGEKVTIGKYELTEAEVGELITEKATSESKRLTLPASAEKYEPTLPADFVAPPGVELQINPDDPLVAAGRQFAHRHKLSQDEFSELVGIYASAKVEEQVFLAKARAAEAAKLGGAAQSRIASVQTFLKGMLGSELAGKMNMMLITADIVSGFETLMSRFTNQGGGAFSQAHRVAPDDASKIPGYETMNFVQRRAAQDSLNNQRRR